MSRPISGLGGRNLVLCSDGTGQRGGKTRTNVWRIYQATDRTSPDPEQLTFYEDGVGSEDFKLIKLIGKATALGLSENMRRLYRWLMLNYQPGDRIFLFGFSRGAFIVRSFAGMLKHCGLVRGDRLDASFARAIAKEVYNHYYRGRWWRRLLSWLPAMKAASRRRLPSSFDPTSVQLDEPLEVVHPEIWFLGVWDTVGAVGLPPWLKSVPWLPVALTTNFHDINANNWWNAYHAVAVDDERRSFWPEPLPQPSARAGFELEDGRQSRPPEPPRGDSPFGSEMPAEPHVEQVLFAGAHTNVGGGYPKDGLAFNALDWIATKARHKGLKITSEARDQIRFRKNAHDRIYDPRAGAAAFYCYAPRDFDRIRRVYEHRHRAHGLKAMSMNRVHETVFDRINQSTAEYGPPNLPADVEVVSTGKGPGGEPKPEEERKVAHYRPRLADPEDRRQREEAFAGVRWPVRIRRALYWVLIGFTLFLAADALWLLEHPTAAPPGAGAATAAADDSTLSRPPLSWVAAAGALVVPGFAETLSRQLLEQSVEHWVVSVPLLLAFGAALYLRQRLKRRCKQLGLAGWHTFRSRTSVAAHGTGDGAQPDRLP